MPAVRLPAAADRGDRERGPVVVAPQPVFALMPEIPFIPALSTGWSADWWNHGGS